MAAWILVGGLIAALTFASAGVAAAQPKPDKKPHRHRVDLTGATKKVGGTLPGPIKDQGTVTASRSATARSSCVVTLNFADSTATGTFRIRNDVGTALGTVDMDFVLDRRQRDHVHAAPRTSPAARVATRASREPT